MDKLGNLFVLLWKRELLFFFFDHNWQESSYSKIRCFNDEIKTKLSNGINNPPLTALKYFGFCNTCVLIVRRLKRRPL